MSRVLSSVVLLWAIFFLSIVSCSRQAPAPIVDVQAVNPAAVRGVLIAPSDQIENCTDELQAQGAKVLYQGQSGLILVDRDAASLKLTKCVASVQANSTLQLTSAVASSADLSTILRLIPAEEIGARTFVKDNPTYDGRGVIVGILDTGIELDHPMLKKTSDGQDKIVGFFDTSGEGHVELTTVTADAAGAMSDAAAGYTAYSVAGSELRFGIFHGSSLKYSTDVAAIDNFDDVGVLAYQVGSEWRARVDLNDNKNFTDDVELYDFAASRLTAKLGKKKSVTFSLTVAKDGKAATLCFDDGSHGTHVAGIAAGYDVSGLQGVAPGAQILAVKIGDNRLAGGSTTTASMLLAIDYAVANKAQIINLSYGIRSGSNLGKSAIDQYIDKIAREKGIIFSISAGNEGPGLLTVGTPAGADLAITNAAYISKRTAKDNYGYTGVEDDNTWYFSSVGPRMDGGWKPTLLAPGSALSSVPLWDKAVANYRGTSMASPQVTGGLALLLSAAQQKKLPTDRTSLTRAVYDGAKQLANLALVEQGHGLMNVPAALTALEARKSDLVVDYALSVNSPTSPTGKGAGIYVRSGKMAANLFTVTVTPSFLPTAAFDEMSKVRTLKLSASADWITLPPDMWLQMSAKTFQVQLDPKVLKTPGLHSEKITATDDKTGRVAFEVPVTVVSPLALVDSNQHQMNVDTTIRVGQTLRYFLDVPAGTTAVQVDLASDGPIVWGQLLDMEGRRVAQVRDAETTSPMPEILVTAPVVRAGVYELDLVAPATNARHAKAKAQVKVFSLSVTKAPSSIDGSAEVTVQNNFEVLKLISEVTIPRVMRKANVNVKGGSSLQKFSIAEDDIKLFSSIDFTVRTAKKIYDLMTDYPYLLRDPAGELLDAGGLELDSAVSLALDEKTAKGESVLEIAGAFTKEAPASWSFELTENRVLTDAVKVSAGGRVLLESGQSTLFTADLSKHQTALAAGFNNCPVLALKTPGARLIQEIALCD